MVQLRFYLYVPQSCEAGLNADDALMHALD